MRNRLRLRDYLDGETVFLAVLALIVFLSGVAAILEAGAREKETARALCPLCGRGDVK